MMREADARQWIVATSFVALSIVLFFFTRGKPFETGARMTISMALIPADAENLDCASDAAFGAVRCAFDRRGNPQEAESALHPYLVSTGMLMLVSGVFESPQTAKWRNRAISENKTGKRTVIECEAVLLGKVDAAAVRWSKDARFQPTPPTWALSASSCRPLP